MWDLPGPGLEPVSPALAGRFITTAPPGKSLVPYFSRCSVRWESLSRVAEAWQGWVACPRHLVWKEASPASVKREPGPTASVLCPQVVAMELKAQARLGLLDLQGLQLPQSLFLVSWQPGSHHPERAWQHPPRHPKHPLPRNQETGLR